MDDREVLFQEYNNLWNEKLVYKQSIRKFHNYLSYITARAPGSGLLWHLSQ